MKRNCIIYQHGYSPPEYWPMDKGFKALLTSHNTFEIVIMNEDYEGVSFTEKPTFFTSIRWEDGNLYIDCAENY